jgi:parallel beta-helix repeat protein
MDNLIIDNSFDGIYLRDSYSNIIMDNTFNSNHGNGLGFICSNNNKISDNTITENIGNGLYFYRSNNNTIIGNNFKLNKCADIHLRNSSNNNTIYHNNFLNKYRNAYDNSINIWDNGYPSGGNYWDDYTGEDSDGDGIGDTPYLIPGGNSKDRYPLMDSLLPKLNIAIKRGLRRSIQVEIENIGSVNVSNIIWNVIVIRRGFIKRNILNISGNISTLKKGLSENIFDRAFGCGFIKVTVNISASGIDPIKITKKGFIFLRFIRLRRFL